MRRTTRLVLAAGTLSIWLAAAMEFDGRAEVMVVLGGPVVIGGLMLGLLYPVLFWEVSA